jgi:hypothetical protein
MKKMDQMMSNQTASLIQKSPQSRTSTMMKSMTSSQESRLLQFSEIPANPQVHLKDHRQQATEAIFELDAAIDHEIPTYDPSYDFVYL